MVSLRDQRRKTIQTLVEWLKPQIPKILQELREREYWDSNIMANLSFDQLDEYKQQLLLGRRVHAVLLAHIRREYMFSHATEYSYVQAVMFQLNCFYDSERRRWLCKIQSQ